MATISTKLFVQHLVLAEQWATENDTHWMAYPTPHEGAYSQWEFSKISMEHPDSSKEDGKYIGTHYQEYLTCLSVKFDDFDKEYNMGKSTYCVNGELNEWEFGADLSRSPSTSNLRGNIECLGIYKKEKNGGSTYLAFYHKEWETYPTSPEERLILEAILLKLSQWEFPYFDDNKIHPWQNAENGTAQLNAHQIATKICHDNTYLLDEIEVKEIIKAWDADRQKLQEYQKSES